MPDPDQGWARLTLSAVPGGEYGGGGRPLPLQISCGGPLNPLKDQYQGWEASVFLTIAPGCWRIPVFSYLRVQVFIISSFQKRHDFYAHNIPRPTKLE